VCLYVHFKILAAVEYVASVADSKVENELIDDASRVIIEGHSCTVLKGTIKIE
jgi:hypothetical protein